jgi:hypothetical protein
VNKNEKIFIGAIILLAMLLALFRLTQTQLLIQDTARDTLKVLTLWQTKTITLIGPPASFSLNSIKEFYFGSFSYYFALIGLILAKFNPTGATLPTILLFLISIPVFYKFLKNIKSTQFVAYTATALYAFSPLTLTHMRFFWNPNTIIPLSVFYWYLVTMDNKKKQFEINFLAGIVAAIIFNFHYFMVIPMLVWGIILITRKQWDSAMGNIFGFLIGTIPLFLFEFKHEFYLSNALVYNLQHKDGVVATSVLVYLGRLGEMFMAILGIKSGEISYSSFFNLSYTWYWMIEIILLGLLTTTIYRLRKSPNIRLIIPAVITIIFASKFSDSSFYTRYAFGAYPLIVWVVAEMVDSKHAKYLLVPIVFLIVYSNFKIITFTPSLSTGYIPLKTVENIAKTIVADNPEGKYNLSENIFGDAQALGLRYFVQRDAKIKPQGVEGYGWLNTLYIVSPSLVKIKSDNRWEYYASAPWKEPKITSIGEVSLFKFEK